MTSLYQQIPEFIQANKRFGVRLVERPTDRPHIKHTAIVCERIGEFSTPYGLKIEKTNGTCVLRNCSTHEFVYIVETKNEEEFFKKMDKI